MGWSALIRQAVAVTRLHRRGRGGRRQKLGLHAHEVRALRGASPEPPAARGGQTGARRDGFGSAGRTRREAPHAIGDVRGVGLDKQLRARDGG